MPSRSASVNTAVSGMNRKMARKSSASPVINPRTQGGSVVTSRSCVAGIAGTAKVTSPLISRSISWSSESIAGSAPSLQQIDQQQHYERDDKHHHRYRCCSLVIEFLELGHNQQGY